MLGPIGFGIFLSELIGKGKGACIDQMIRSDRSGHAFEKSGGFNERGILAKNLLYFGFCLCISFPIRNSKVFTDSNSLVLFTEWVHDTGIERTDLLRGVS